MLVSNGVSYGGVGVVLVVESWLTGVGFVIYGGALFGNWFCAHHWWSRMIDHDAAPPAE
jgi:membrane protein